MGKKYWQRLFDAGKLKIMPSRQPPSLRTKRRVLLDIESDGDGAPTAPAPAPASAPAPAPASAPAPAPAPSKRQKVTLSPAQDALRQMHSKVPILGSDPLEFRMEEYAAMGEEEVERRIKHVKRNYAEARNFCSALASAKRPKTTPAAAAEAAGVVAATDGSVGRINRKQTSTAVSLPGTNASAAFTIDAGKLEEEGGIEGVLQALGAELKKSPYGMMQHVMPRILTGKAKSSISGAAGQTVQFELLKRSMCGGVLPNPDAAKEVFDLLCRGANEIVDVVQRCAHGWCAGIVRVQGCPGSAIYKVVPVADPPPTFEDWKPTKLGYRLHAVEHADDVGQCLEEFVGDYLTPCGTEFVAKNNPLSDIYLEAAKAMWTKLTDRTRRKNTDTGKKKGDDSDARRPLPMVGPLEHHQYRSARHLLKTIAAADAPAAASDAPAAAQTAAIRFSEEFPMAAIDEALEQHRYQVKLEDGCESIAKALLRLVDTTNPFFGKEEVGEVYKNALFRLCATQANEQVIVIDTNTVDSWVLKLFGRFLSFVDDRLVNKISDINERARGASTRHFRLEKTHQEVIDDLKGRVGLVTVALIQKKLFTLTLMRYNAFHKDGESRKAIQKKFRFRSDNDSEILIQDRKRVDRHAGGEVAHVETDTSRFGINSEHGRERFCEAVMLASMTLGLDVAVDTLRADIYEAGLDSILASGDDTEPSAGRERVARVDDQNDPAKRLAKAMDEMEWIDRTTRKTGDKLVEHIDGLVANIEGALAFHAGARKQCELYVAAFDEQHLKITGEVERLKQIDDDEITQWQRLIRDRDESLIESIAREQAFKTLNAAQVRCCREIIKRNFLDGCGEKTSRSRHVDALNEWRDELAKLKGVVEDNKRGDLWYDFTAGSVRAKIATLVELQVTDGPPIDFAHIITTEDKKHELAHFRECVERLTQKADGIRQKMLDVMRVGFSAALQWAEVFNLGEVRLPSSRTPKRAVGASGIALFLSVAAAFDRLLITDSVEVFEKFKQNLDYGGRPAVIAVLDELSGRRRDIELAPAATLREVARDNPRCIAALVVVGRDVLSCGQSRQQLTDRLLVEADQSIVAFSDMATKAFVTVKKNVDNGDPLARLPAIDLNDHLKTTTLASRVDQFPERFDFFFHDNDIKTVAKFRLLLDFDPRLNHGTNGFYRFSGATYSDGELKNGILDATHEKHSSIDNIRELVMWTQAH